MTVYWVCNCLRVKQRTVKNKQAKLLKQTPDEYEKKNKQPHSFVTSLQTQKSAGRLNMFISGRSICNEFVFFYFGIGNHSVVEIVKWKFYIL